MRQFLSVFLSAFILLCSFQQALAQPLVVASIKPLQLIAMAVTEGVSQPALVLDGSQDPHHPSLRPSQRRAMDNADIFIWTGPQLETGLDRVTSQLQAQVLTALQVPGLTLHPLAGSTDPHIWLDTRNAVLIAAELTLQLSAVDTVNAAKYRSNLDRFKSDMQALEPGIRAALGTGSFPPFAVYHDGYQYFEKQFGLSHVTSFISNEEVQPGIRQVLAIKKQLDEHGVNCIVVDSSNNTTFLDNQVGRSDMQYVIIDVLATESALTRDGYGRFMEDLADSLAGCRQ